jgi:hypothetical protein
MKQLIIKNKKLFFLVLFIITSLLLAFKFVFNENNEIEIIKNEKYVVLECVEDNGWLCGGWADRLKGIMSAYAWSLISDRKLIIHITKPCQLTNFYIPNEIDWHKDINKILKIKNIKNKSTQFKLWQWGGIKYEMSDYKYEKFNPNNSHFVFIRNNIDWLDPFSKNKYIHQRIIQLGYNPNEFKMQFLFKNWFNKLFKLNPILDEKYKYYLNLIKPNNKNIKLICAQIRTEFLQQGGAHLFWNYIRNNFISNIKNENYNIFLTTDSIQIEKDGKKEFGDKLFLINGTIVNIDHTLIRNSPYEIEKTFLDFHMLQNCDMAIISESGFGKLGVWNRLDPNKNLVTINKKQEIEIKNTTNDLFIW